MASDRWSPETTIKFIQEIRSYKCLWNQTSIRYRRHVKEAALQKVVEEMNIYGFGIEDAKRKMRNLRSTFYQEKKKIQDSIRSGSDSDTMYVPNIPWYKEMDSFLRNVDDSQTAVENVCNHFLSEMKEEKPDIGDLNPNTDDSETSEQISIKYSPPPVRRASKQKGIFRAVRGSPYMINKEEEYEEKDRFGIFGESVAMQLRSLSFERGMIGQARIQNLLTELSIEDYREKESVSTEILPTVCSSSPSFSTG